MTIINQFKKINIIKFIFVLFLFFIIGLNLTSCNDTKENEVSLISFNSTEDSYAYKEVLTFEVKFKNNMNYTINSVQINNKDYPVICSDERYDLVYVTDNTLIFLPGSETFKMTGFSYTLTTNEGDVIIDVETSKTCFIAYSVKEDNDIKLINYSIKSKVEDETELFINEEVEVEVNLNNPYKYEVSRFIFGYYNENNEVIERVEKLVFSTDSKKDYSVYNFTLKLYSEAGDYNLKLDSIYYTKETALIHSKVTEDYDDVSKIAIKLNKRQIEILELSFNKLAENNINIDVNNKSYTDSDSDVNLMVKLKNESNVTIKALVINGTSYKISKDMIATNTVTNIQTIKFKVKVSSNSSSGNINTCQFALTKIKLEDNQATELLIPVQAELKVYVYDKVIKTASDLDSMKIDETTKTITGNYILANDITISKNLHGKLFSDYVFDGMLEGNGKTIKFSSDLSLNEKPMFEKIGANGIIKNTKFTQAIFKNTNAIANINDGIIKNVETIMNIIHKPTASQKEISRGGLVGINNGTISDISLKGSLEVQYYTTSSKPYHFSLVAHQNNGNIFRVINNITDITADKEIGNSFVYLTSYENNGTIAQIVYLLSNITIKNFAPLTIVTDSYAVGEDGVFENVYINSDFIYKVALERGEISKDELLVEKLFGFIDNIKNFANELINGSTEYYQWITFNQDKCKVKEATPEDLGIVASDSGKNLVFYARLGFGSGGNDEFWSYSSGTPKFDFDLNK